MGLLRRVFGGGPERSHRLGPADHDRCRKPWPPDDGPSKSLGFRRRLKGEEHREDDRGRREPADHPTSPSCAERNVLHLDVAPGSEQGP